MRLAVLMAVVAALICAAPPVRAEPFRSAHVEIELHSARAAIAPGEHFTIALRQEMAEGWHTYWRNPGDSGEPTHIAWRLPPGFEAGALQWPAPQALPFEMLVNYGYSGEVLYPIEITAPAGLRLGQSVTLNADLDWLVCSNVCIPEQGAISLTLPVAAQSRDDPQWAARIAAAIAALPKRDASIEARISAGAPARLSITLAGAERVRDAHFFPYSRDAINHAAPQAPGVGPRGVSFSLKAGADDNLGSAPLDGVVTLTRSNGAHTAYEITAQPGPPLPQTGDAPMQQLAAAMTWPALVAAAGFAFLGGLILNIMPCVLPVLSMKALSFAGGAHSGQARRHGLLYAIGAVASFLVLAGILIALRGAGEAVGWGFQLQIPLVTAGLALLFFAIGLNLLGVFEIGGGLQNLGASATERSGDVGAALTGALAVVAATPCTAPFMAGAIGAAMTQSALTMLLIFAALGLGFATPMLALAFAPGLQRALPKPGPWMERVKQVLAFPMFGAAIYLAYVLGRQQGAIGGAALLALAAALAFVLMAARWGRAWLAVGVVVLALATAWAWGPITAEQTHAARTAQAQTWSPERVAQLRAEGRGVFVNFTAAWCVTCQINEITALSRPAVVQAFADDDIAYLKADWTNRNAQIAEALSQFGAAGIPLYVYYPPGGEAIVLPQTPVLSEDLVLRTISTQR